MYYTYININGTNYVVIVPQEVVAVVNWFAICDIPREFCFIESL